MTILKPHVAARLFGTPLLIDEGKLAAIAAGLGGRIVAGGFTLPVSALDHVAFADGRPSERMMSEHMGVLSDRLGRRYEEWGEGERILDRVGGVACIAVEGSLIHKGRWLNSYSGDTSYEGLQTQIVRAHRNPVVRGVVLEVDSFGGEAAGAFDTADMIADLSADKPTIAILTDHACSGAYLLAAACRQVVMPANGVAGSIGVVVLHVDYSEQLKAEGIAVTLLKAGAHKTDGNPFEPLPEAVAKRVTAEIEQTRDRFAEAIGRYRGTRLTKAAALATEGQVYRGAEALALGLVDGLVRPSEAFAAFVAAVR